MKRIEFIRQVDKDVWVLLPAIALTKEDTLHSFQIYFLCFRFAIIWGKDLC